MATTFQIFLLLLTVFAATAAVAKKFNLAPAILLMVVGITLAFMPGLPRVVLEPEVVMQILLPPLIYSAGVSMSWREFKFNLRPIMTARHRLQ